jgi:phytoene desaturase
MYKIVEGILKELKNRNVTFSFNTEIVGYKGNKNKILSLVDQNNKIWKSDIFIINADAAYFRGSILKRKKFSQKKLDSKRWTLGFLTIYLGIKGKIPQINHHNYYLGDNYDEYAHNVFHNPGTIQKPYYYVNAISKYNSEYSPEGCESLFFVCPVPDLRYKSNWNDKENIFNSIIEDFSNRIKVDIKSRIITKTIFTPEDWQNRFNLYRGSGLGLSHDFFQIGAFRPKNYDEKYKNLFYVGASTLPGSGIPMVVISSKLVTQRIIKYTIS